MNVIGIDPGIAGGVACVDLNFECRFAEIMPMAGSFVDGKALIEYWTNQFGDFTKPTLVLIEKVSSRPEQGVASTFKFGTVYGQVLGAVQGMGWAWEMVRPQAWKRLVLAGTSRDKSAAVERVTGRYPDVELKPGRMRKPHDGIAEAVCIAEYGIMRYQQNQG